MDELPADQFYYERACQYAVGVVEGEIVACKWIKLQCKQFIDDIARIPDEDFPYKFDIELGEKAAFFIETLPLTKVKGRFKRGQRPRLMLEPWQIFVVMCIFGWIDKEEGYRRFREVLLFIPRKNGKSEFAASIALVMLLIDNEDAAEIYCGGKNERQANYVFKAVKRMIALMPALGEHFGISVLEENISVPETMSKLERLIGNPEDGGDPHLYVADEYHEYPTNAQFETMQTGMISRMQPMTIIPTTAGINIEGPCHAYVADAQRALMGVLTRPELFAMIFTIDEGDDWKSELALEKSNPGYGTLIPKQSLRTDQRTAIEVPRKAQIFKIKHLNIWQGSTESYFDVEAWLGNAIPEIDEEELIGDPCIVAVDLSGRRDLSAAVRIFEKRNGGFHLKPTFYLPKDAVEDLYAPDHDIRRWADQGHIELTDGSMVDVFQLADDVNYWRSIHDVRDIVYDAAHALAFIQIMQKTSAPLFEFPNNAVYMNEPMQTCAGLVQEGKVTHDNNPVMNWMIANVAKKKRGRDDLHYPSKADNRSENKIDGPVAMLMAYGRQLTTQGDEYDFSARRVW